MTGERNDTGYKERLELNLSLMGSGTLCFWHWHPFFDYEECILHLYKKNFFSNLKIELLSFVLLLNADGVGESFNDNH